MSQWLLGVAGAIALIGLVATVGLIWMRGDDEDEDEDEAEVAPRPAPTPAPTPAPKPAPAPVSPPKVVQKASRRAPAAPAPAPAPAPPPPVSPDDATPMFADHHGTPPTLARAVKQAPAPRALAPGEEEDEDDVPTIAIRTSDHLDLEALMDLSEEAKPRARETDR